MSTYLRRLAPLLAAVLVAACSPSAPRPSAAWGETVPAPATAYVPIGHANDSVTLAPLSPKGAKVGVAYRYEMPHCGINSPIDVDGSFWDAVGIAQDSVDLDGRSGAFRLLARDTAEFTANDGSVLHLTRHTGAKTFRLCA